MAIRYAILSLVIFMTSACGALRVETEEYGTTTLTRGLSICDAELWTSNEADEKICIRRSLQHPDRFLMTQDASEYWADAVTALMRNYYSPFSYLINLPDDDTPERWQKAADQYMRKHYGAKAEMIMFKSVVAPGGYVFEVQPGDQIPLWEETELPEFVLASQMSEHFWRSLGREFAGRRPSGGPPSGAQPVKVYGGPSRSLTAMLDRAVASSLQPRQENRFVAVETLDPIEYRKFLARAAANAPVPLSLSNSVAK